MAITVSYNALVTELERELTLTLLTLEDPTRFKRKLSQAKHRAAIDGKLIFSVVKTAEGNAISIALMPKRSTLQVLSVDKKGGL